MHLRPHLLVLVLLVAACGERLEPQQKSEPGSEVEPVERQADAPTPWRAGGRQWSASYEGIKWLGRQQAMDGGWEDERTPRPQRRMTPT